LGASFSSLLKNKQ